ncbi:MAG TPA: LamG domain-containing protein, partial [Saprospiraceae bacterium]|nr:LamG domain-containing protein [Saprospiraceae bacterium]
MNRILFCLILLTNIASAQVDLSLGLRAYYPFSGNTNDVSGNNNNPVFNNATLTADRNGIANSAYHFDGSTNYMRIINNPSINMTNKMSIAAWVKPMGFYSGTCHNNMLLSKGDADYLTGNYSLRYTPDPLSGCVSNPPLSQNVFYSVNSIATTPFVELNKWYSVVWTSDGITANIYVDCQLRGSVPAGSFSFTNSFDLYFGKMNNGTFPYWLNGDLDEIRIYDRALNQEEVNVLGGCNATIPCNNWLNTPTEPSFVNIGNLNVTGNIITVEALINRTQAYTGGIGNGNEGDVVSKHDSPSDVNYLLRPNHAYITTNNGFFGTPDICEIEINKIYHVAMVYDGTTLKFYRNGFLMSQVPATGNLFQNNWPTRIGRYTGTITSSFLGYTNEVRIWNIARTQTEIRAYMNNPLPAPTTQPGLLAYYTFDNLLNKQGNHAWHGTLGGAASINQSVT